MLPLVARVRWLLAAQTTERSNCFRIFKVFRGRDLARTPPDGSSERTPKHGEELKVVPQDREDQNYIDAWN